MVNKIGTFIKISGNDLNDAIGYSKFDNSPVIGMKIGMSTMIIFGENAGEILELPNKFDKLKKYDVKMADPSDVGIVLPWVQDDLDATPDDLDATPDDYYNHSYSTNKHTKREFDGEDNNDDDDDWGEF